MLKVTLLVLLIFLLSGAFSKSSAEEFQVFFAFRNVDNTDFLSDRPNLTIDLSRIYDEEEQVKTLSRRVIKDELEENNSYETRHIVFSLDSITKKDDAWYVVYKWEYASHLIDHPQKKPERLFVEKIDLKNRVIYHERSKDNQYTGP